MGAIADSHRPYLQQAIELMADYADRTGLASTRPPKRYLWTDAYAVTNYLAFWWATEDDKYLDLAFRLIDQVHHTLGKHRSDDNRYGWLSGLSDAEARQHPTQGGLRIGKIHPERGLDQKPNSKLEWERDGQYFHYLTRWMHALDQTSRVTHKPQYNQWAQELADVAYRGFSYVLPRSRRPRLYWKMSIDLSRPLVPSMGQHDPLDGSITCAQLRATAREIGNSEHAGLIAAQTGLAAMTEHGDWITSEPLGLGGLLAEACRADQLSDSQVWLLPDLKPVLLHASLVGLRTYARRGDFAWPSVERIAFRELGLAIGLSAVENMTSLEATGRTRSPQVTRLLQSLHSYVRLQSEIRDFWLQPQNRYASSWGEHRNINDVMLATTLVPDGLLVLPSVA